MKWYYDLKISVKLISAFVVVALLGGLVGAFGIINLRNLGNEDVKLYEKNTLAVVNMDEIQADFLRVRVTMRLAMNNDGADKSQVIADVKKLFDKIDKNIGKYESYADTNAEKEEFGNFKVSIENYKVTAIKIANLIIENNVEGALAVAAATPQIIKAAESSIQRMVDLNLQQAKERIESNKALVEKTTIVMIVVAMLGMLVAIGLGLFLAKVIGRPINKIVDAANNIAKGNLDIALNYDTNDEIGNLVHSFGRIIASLRSLVADSEMLVQAAVEGKLATRADVSKHEGDYRKIIAGVNKTLDAVIQPIKESAIVLREMSNGNLQLRVVGDYQGEHADIKNAMNETLDSLSAYVNEISEVLGQMANSNLDLEINNEYKGDFAKIKDALTHIIKSFNEVFGEINNAADQVASGSRQVSDGSQALSQGATEQASSVEQLTVSISQVAAQTKDNAMNATKANELALVVKENAEQGNHHMNKMLKSMEEINESSAKISKIIKVIDEIAFQTNILALNAAVEAARAGQHGKGFAVVAEEVRNLAARSANAAKETTALIEGSIKNVEAGTRTANGTARSLEEIVKGVATAAGLVGDIASASNEQATAIAQINQGIEQVAQVVQTNSATAEESAAASEELSGQADMLKEMISKFRLQKDAMSYARYEKNEYPSGNKKGKPERSISAGRSEAAATKSKPRIALSDKEFGKY